MSKRSRDYDDEDGGSGIFLCGLCMAVVMTDWFLLGGAFTGAFFEALIDP